MEQQSLLIGLGGTGSRVVNNVTKLLTKNGKTFNDNLGRICCAVLDSDKNDNELITKSRTQIPVFRSANRRKFNSILISTEIERLLSGVRIHPRSASKACLTAAPKCV